MRREAITGLPRPLDRRLVKRYGQSTPARIKLAAGMKALSVLLRRHPGAALDMAAAAALKAGQLGVHAMVERLERVPTSDQTTPPRRPLSRSEARRFLRMLHD